MVDMEVWDESNERRSGPPRRSRIRRFHDWKDVLIFLTQIVGLCTVGGSCAILILSSLGFTFSGSKEAIATIKAADVVRDSRIAKLEEEEPIKLLMLCGLYSKQFPEVPALCDKAISRAGPRK